MIPTKIPTETAPLEPAERSAVWKDWMVETNWTKLAAPPAVIETSLRNSSQERIFVLQRPGGETGSFGSIAGAETALTREFGRHVFEIAALLRVSQRLHNSGVLVQKRVCYELAPPHAVLSTRVSATRLDRCDIAFAPRGVRIGNSV